MPTLMKESTRDLGIDSAVSNGADIDKSMSIKDLPEEVGKQFQLITTSHEAEPLPTTDRIATEVSTPYALAIDRLGVRRSALLSQLPPRAWFASRAHVAEFSSGDSTMSGKKNPFRIQLHRSLCTSTDHPTKRAAFLAALPFALKARFSEELAVDSTILLHEAAPASPIDAIDTNLYAALINGFDEGWILTELSGKAGKGRTPYAFDLRGASPSFMPATLGDVLRSYVASGASTSAIRAVLAATRSLLGLPRHSRETDTIRAADAVRDFVFHSLPSRFQDEALKQGHLDRKTIQNHASALRALLTHGLEHNLFPLYFPEWRPADNYLAAINEAFPLEASSVSANPIRQVRSGLLLLASVLREDLGIADITCVADQDVRDALALLSSPTRIREFDRIKALRKHIRRVDGNWEHPSLLSIVSVVEGTRRAPAVPYLAHPSVTGSSRDDAAFLELLRVSGLPSSWSSFVAWYRDFSRLSDDQIFEREAEFPARFPQRHLTEATFLSRFAVIRAYVGVAISCLKLDASLLTPEAVFGTLFESITRKIRMIWSSEVGKSVSHKSSMGLHHLVYSGGLMGEALYMQSLHARRLTTSKRERKPGHESLDYALEEIAVDRTSTERALFGAYRYAQATCSTLKKSRVDSSRLRSGNTVKDLVSLIRESPAENYVKAQAYLLDQIHGFVRIRRTLTAAERSTVVGTLHNGILLSAGLRLGEPGVMRVGIHLPEDFRTGARFELNQNDRKNNRHHAFTFLEEFLPDWFLDFYRTVVWPDLKKRGGLESTPYPWLLLSPRSGKPYLNEDEGLAGENRKQNTRKDRSAKLAALWKRTIGDACKSLSIPLTGKPFSVTPHCVRNVVGNEFFQKSGAKDAAAFLGDREGTVQDVYGVLDGMSVNSASVLVRSRP